MSKRTRIKACELAAQTLMSEDEPYMPALWSLCVFYEMYIERGADGTAKDFGPAKAKRAPVIKLVPKRET